MNEKNIENFIMLLQQVKSPNLFNPYTDVCPFHDIGTGSPKIRTNNLRAYFSFLKKTDTLLMGEAAGYLGCRRTGLAFTDEWVFKIIKKELGIVLIRATKSGKQRELSASQVWDALRKLKHPPFLWNIVPFHPHKTDNPLTNRTPNKTDHKASEDVMKFFLSNTDFKRIFAIGNVAKKKLEEFQKDWNFDIEYIRHPSHGGAKKFTETIFQYFEQKPIENKLEKFLQ